jgi:hypothetical protein
MDSELLLLFIAGLVILWITISNYNNDDPDGYA